MKEEKFIKKNETDWEKLKTLSREAEKTKIKKMSSKKVQNFLLLFRRVSHHLAYARTHYPESETVDYLNTLVGSAHSHVYAVKKISPRSIPHFLFKKVPQMLYRYRWYIATATLCFLLGGLISAALVSYDPDLARLFLPESYADVGQEGELGAGEWNYALMSSYIMVNNIIVSLNAFVLGITLGVGTIYILFLNGSLLGALTTLIYQNGSPIEYWSLILPHGIIELTAIFISGGAGLLVAKSILIPGKYTRKDALIDAAKKAVTLLAGVIMMLIIAGLIEGFFTPLNIAPELKLAFAGSTCILLVIYFLLPQLYKFFADNGDQQDKH
ncbi:MAG: stage II sporulation protein M [Bacillota bacterium]